MKLILKGIWAIPVLAGILISGLIVFGGIYDPFGSISQENDLKSNQFLIEPTTSSLEFTTSKIIPHTEIINPESFVGESKTGTLSNEILKNEASAIPSTQLTVTYTRWSGSISSVQPNIRSLDLDSSNNVYWGQGINNKITRLVPTTNTITEWTPPSNPPPLGSNIAHVAIDSSDKIWWQEILGQNIGRLDPLTNVMTIWNFGFFMRDIEIDSANNVWFSSGTNEIFRLDPLTNQFTGWLVEPVLSADPHHIAIDSSDNIWFLVDNPDKIGRLVPSTNTVTLWNLPDPTSMQGSNDLAVDSTGKIFFGEDHGNGVVSKIGRFDPSTNQLTEWDLPTSDNRTFGVGIDSVDTVYVGVFSNTLPDKVVRLVPSTNVITEFTIIGKIIFLPNIVSPTELVVDPFDNVWVPEFSLGDIGRLS